MWCDLLLLVTLSTWCDALGCLFYFDFWVTFPISMSLPDFSVSLRSSSVRRPSSPYQPPPPSSRETLTPALPIVGQFTHSVEVHWASLVLTAAPWKTSLQTGKHCAASVTAVFFNFPFNLWDQNQKVLFVFSVKKKKKKSVKCSINPNGEICVVVLFKI